MLRWFREIAPSRLKLTIAFGIQAGFVLISAAMNVFF